MRRILFTLCLLSALLVACDPPPRVLVVGLDGADWDVMDPLMEAGELPTIAGLVEGGVRADFNCYSAWPALPCFCPPVWTTISTGQPASVHGYINLGWPSSAVQVPTIWDVLDADGRKAILSSWRATWPPPPGRHTVFTEPGLGALARINYRIWKEASPDRNAARETWTHPESLVDVLGLAPFEPQTDLPVMQIYGRDRVAMEGMLRLHDLPPLLRYSLAEATLTMILIHGIDKAEHTTWAQIQPRHGDPIDEDIIRQLAERWTGPLWGFPPFQFMNVVSQYMETDAWLAELLEREDYDYILFVSDHGMDRNNVPSPFPGHHHAGLPESHIGIFAITGPGVRRGVQLEDEVDVHDFAPTLAYVLGLPIAADLPGRVLTEAFESRWLRWSPIETVESWVGWEPEPETDLERWRSSLRWRALRGSKNGRGKGRGRH